MNLTVLDINVWHGLYARTLWRAERLESAEARERRQKVLVDSIRELSPDVIALQECFPQPAYGRDFAAALGYEHVSRVSNAGFRMLGFGLPAGVKTGEGSSILAKPGLGLEPLAFQALSGFGWTHALVSLQPVPRRCALAATVTVGGKKVAIVTSHLRYEFGTEADLEKAWAALARAGQVQGELPAEIVERVRGAMTARDAEVSALRELCREIGSRFPYVIAADMNLDDDAPSLREFVRSLELTSALAAAGSQRSTWDPANPNVAASSAYVHPDGKPKDVPSLVVAEHDRMPQRPDHIFLGPTFARTELLDARIVLDGARDGVVPSDHYGILVNVRIG